MRLVLLILCVSVGAIFAPGASASTGNCKPAVKNAYPTRTNSRTDRFCNELGDRYGKKKKPDSKISGTVGNEKHYDPLGKMYIVHAGMHLPYEAELAAETSSGEEPDADAPGTTAGRDAGASAESGLASQLKESFLGLGANKEADAAVLERTLLASGSQAAAPAPTPAPASAQPAPQESAAATAETSPGTRLQRALAAASLAGTELQAAPDGAPKDGTIFERVSKRYRLLSTGLR